MISPTGACQSFSNDANGYVRSDAIGAVLIEHTKALKDFETTSKPPIVMAMCTGTGGTDTGNSEDTGVDTKAATNTKTYQGALLDVVGTGTNSDGYKEKGITFPSNTQQLALFKRVFESNNLNPMDVGYVEAHGTGTTAGDGVELTSIDDMFGCRSYSDPTTGTTTTNTNTTVHRKPLLIGSVKSNMGHSEAASGLMSLLKVFCIQNEGVIPPNLHYPLPEEAIQDSKHEQIRSHRIKVVNKLHSYTGEGHTDSTDPTDPNSSTNTSTSLVVVNNFGFGGTNATCVTAKNPQSVMNTTTKPTRYIFGRTKEALEAYVANGDLNEAAWRKYMRSSGLVHKYPWRGVVGTETTETTGGSDTGTTGGSDTGLVLLDATECTNITTTATTTATDGTSDGTMPPMQLPTPTHNHTPVAFCYSGQGSQWNHMGKELYQTEPTFRRVIEDACVGLPFLSRVVEGVNGTNSGASSDRRVDSISELFQDGSLWMSKQWSGFGITLVQLGLTAMLNEAGIYPDYIFGHSVGEVACGYADGCLTAKQVAHLAFTRCECAVNADGLMMAVGVSLEDANTKIMEFDYSKL